MILLLDLPKPVHGMSNVNLAITEFIKEEGYQTKVINTVPSYFAHLFPGKAWGLAKFAHTFYCYVKIILLMCFNQYHTIYRPINGGGSQVYDLFYILISRVFTKKLFIHHHSFNYLNRTSKLFSLLNKIAGKNSTHIVLGKRMADLLVERYGIQRDKIIILSNLAFFETITMEAKTVNSKLRIGHLANLCSEKGVNIFVDVCKKLNEMGVEFSAQVAGPFVDEATKKYITKSLQVIPQLEYLGPLYADKKLAFYEGLDCFIFPSKYNNEAEPLVLYEAGMFGAYIMGTQRGSMKDVIESLEGYSIDEKNDVAQSIAEKIKSQIDSEGFSLNNRKDRIELFRQKRLTAKPSLLLLLEEMSKHEATRSS